MQACGSRHAIVTFQPQCLRQYAPPSITTENHNVELAFIAFVGTSVLMGLEFRDFVRRRRVVIGQTESLRTERSTIVEENLYKKAA